MIVHDPYGLQEGIHDGRADKAEPPALEVLAEGLGQGGLRRDGRAGRARIRLGLPPGKAPEVGVKALEPPLHLQEGQGVADRGFQLEPVAHDPRVEHERRHGFGGIAGHLRRIEPDEGLPVGLPLAQDGDPAQPGLGALQGQQLEQPEVIVQGHPPFLVVIGHVEGIAAAPGAARRVFEGHGNLQDET